MIHVKPLSSLQRARGLALRLALALVLAAGAATAGAQQGPQLKLPTTTLTAGMYLIHAELDSRPSSRRSG